MGSALRLFLLGLIGFIGSKIFDNPADDLGLFLLGMFVVGAYGLTKYVYDTKSDD